jgi:hypothetical protein
VPCGSGADAPAGNASGVGAVGTPATPTTMHSAAPLHVIALSEARDVLCELHGNRRFGYLPTFVSASPEPEHPLVADIKRVRDAVRFALRGRPHAVLAPDALAVALDPFLRIVQSRDTSGNITGVALHSLDCVAAAVLALPAHILPDYTPVLSSIVSAAASCRFDASDPSKDEVIIARIARVIVRISTSTVAALCLSDAAILQCFEACLTIAAGRRRTTDLLKRTADAALIEIAGSLSASLTASSADAATSSGPIDLATPASPSSAAIVDYLTGGSYGYASDVDSHLQRGPASAESVAAILELASQLSDRAIPRPPADRILCLHLVTIVLSAGGTALCSLRRFVAR